MANKTRVRELRDLTNIPVSIVVDSPVPDLRTRAEQLLDDDDDVFLTLLLPGGVKADIMVSVAEYRAITKGADNARGALATSPLPFD